MYVFHSKKTTDLIHSKKDEISSNLIGSWTVHVGDMDQCIHLWRYTGGFEKIDDAYRILEKDKVFTFTLLSNRNYNQRFFKLFFF